MTNMDEFAADLLGAAEPAPPVPAGGGAVMAARRGPAGLDFFPTPPWATRALFEYVLPALDDLGIPCAGAAGLKVWEPACGAGHMGAVIQEYAHVMMSDIANYGLSPAETFKPVDFLNFTRDYPNDTVHADWIITNPPFGAAVDFAETALRHARVGVALLCRTQWIESAERYTRLFRDRPPALFAPFCERVPMVKGRWDPKASTATGYAWFVWLTGASPPAHRRGARFDTVIIPPGQRKALTRADDAARFAAWQRYPAPREDIERIARELCAADGIDPDAIGDMWVYDALTYADRHQQRAAAMVRGRGWESRIREVDDIWASRLTADRLTGRAQ